MTAATAALTEIRVVLAAAIVAGMQIMISETEVAHVRFVDHGVTAKHCAVLGLSREFGETTAAYVRIWDLATGETRTDVFMYRAGDRVSLTDRWAA